MNVFVSKICRIRSEKIVACPPFCFIPELLSKRNGNPSVFKAYLGGVRFNMMSLERLKQLSIEAEMKLMFVVVRDPDADTVAQAHVENQHRVTQVASTGGFMRNGNV